MRDGLWALGDRIQTLGIDLYCAMSILGLGSRFGCEHHY